MPSLSDLAIEFGTDKRPEIHNYTPIYENLFGYNSNRVVSNLLEIGFGNGASAKMWMAYFARAQISVIEKCGDEFLSLWANPTMDIVGLDVYKGDSTDKEVWGFVPYALDVIIDDGSHFADDQIKTFMYGFDHVKEGGLYVIEDTHCNFHPSFECGVNIYDWLYELIVGQQKDLSNGDFYKTREKMKGISKNIFGYYLYKSLIVFEKAQGASLI